MGFFFYYFKFEQVRGSNDRVELGIATHRWTVRTDRKLVRTHSKGNTTQRMLIATHKMTVRTHNIFRQNPRMIRILP